MRCCPGPNRPRAALARLAASAAVFAATACLAPETTAPSVSTVAVVASVPVSPASGTVPVGQTLQLSATPRDSSGDPLAGRAVTWATSDSAVATVDGKGRVTGISEGSVIITASSEGKRGTAIIVVQGVPLPAGSPDPTLLPVASGQLPDVVGYTALSVASQPAGFSYHDPVTGVRVWKVTSSSVPIANSGAGHDYSDGPNEVSLGWGPNNNTHTILIGAPQAVRKYYLVDFTSGVGFSNYRRLTVQPDRDLCVSFSNVPGQERIVYILTPTQIVRYNTATMQVENGGNFPLDLSAVGGAFSWLQHDKADAWFAGLTGDQSVAFAWNSQTNQFLTHGEAWLNEPRLERDGRYIALTNGNSTFRLWDLATNSFGPVQSDRIQYWLGHNANLRSQWVTTDVNADAPFDLDRYSPSGDEIVKVQIFKNSAGAGVHHSGNWVQSDAELGGDLNRQWSIFSGIDAMWPGVDWRQAIGIVRSNGSDARLLVHHYDLNPASYDYFSDPFAQTSPDGRLVIFNSNMLASGRYDLFVAEMPLR